MLEVGLTKRRGDFKLTAAFSMNSETMVVSGPSGAGKTTLLRCLAGLERPDTGGIRFNGRCLYRDDGINVPCFRRPVGLMSQEDAVFPHLTVKENILYAWPKARNVPALYPELLDRLELSPFENVYPGSLSGGEKRRVALARTLLRFPALLLLDEPFTALDQRLAVKVSELLFDYCRSFAPAAIIVTHSHERLIYWSGQHLRLSGGKVRAVTAEPCAAGAY